ncbi:MAG: glycosyltransferase family 39 protein [Verrucomicrobiae bacterium]|nr:glycosyltransferase family 39 protein [Verrucomicrobiae bacterium]
MSRSAQRWAIGAALALVLAALRFPWLEADPGSPGIWPFGAFSSDEAEYTGGGRLHHLTGQWLDPEMGYPSTLNYAAAMHLFSAISYGVCGLTTAAARWPTAWAAVIAWLLAYFMAARVTAPWLAGLVTLALSCNPFSLTYERWGSSDVVFSAEIVLAWWLLRRASPGRAAAAGLVAGFAVLTKTTAVLFAPFLLAEAWMRSQARARAATGFAVVLAATCVGGWLWVNAYVHAVGHGILSRSENLHTWSILTSQASVILKALASFPRAPTMVLLGPFTLWLFLFPVWILVIGLRPKGGRFSSRETLGAALCFYSVALATQARNPGRYFLPLFYFTPLILVYARQTGFRAVFRPLASGLALALAVAGITFLYWRTPGFPSDGALYVFDDSYNPSLELAWIVSWPVLLTATALLALVALLRFGGRGGMRHRLAIAALAISTGWFLTIDYGYSALKASRVYLFNQALLQTAAVLGFGAILAGRRWARWPYWYGFAAWLFLASSLFNPCWRNAYPGLKTRRYTVRDSAAKIATLLPPDAVVIGRRAGMLLQNTRMRIGLYSLCSAGRNKAGKLADRIALLLKSAPDGAVYWLFAVDEPRLYVSPEQNEIRERFQIEIVGETTVPGDSSPAPVLLFVLKLREPVRSASRPVADAPLAP